jgi:hypothetical protein
VRRARLCAHPTLRARGGVHFGWWLSSSHRPQHMGKPGRSAAAAGNDRTLSSSHPLPNARRFGRRPAPSAAGGHPLDGASDHGVSEALYLRDPDQNGVELYWDRPNESWPRTPAGDLSMFTRPLDLASLLKTSSESHYRHSPTGASKIPTQSGQAWLGRPKETCIPNPRNESERNCEISPPCTSLSMTNPTLQDDQRKQRGQQRQKTIQSLQHRGKILSRAVHTQ